MKRLQLLAVAAMVAAMGSLQAWPSWSDVGSAASEVGSRAKGAVQTASKPTVISVTNLLPAYVDPYGKAEPRTVYAAIYATSSPFSKAVRKTPVQMMLSSHSYDFTLPSYSPAGNRYLVFDADQSNLKDELPQSTKQKFDVGGALKGKNFVLYMSDKAEGKPNKDGVVMTGGEASDKISQAMGFAPTK